MTCAFFLSRGWLRGGEVPAGEAAEDLFSADLVRGQVDLQRRGAHLSGRELVKSASGRAVLQCCRYSVRTWRRWCSSRMSSRSKTSRRRVTIVRSQIAFVLGASAG